MKRVMLPSIWFLVCLLVGAVGVRAQDIPKFEVGGQFSLIKFSEQKASQKLPNCLGTNCQTITQPFSDPIEPGFGGRLGYNINRNIALEAEMNFFPRDKNFEGGRKLQGLFGIKAGRRFGKFGLFAKGRPGFLRESKEDFTPQVRLCIAIFPPPVGCSDPISKTNFAIDIGGVVEYSFSKRFVLRFDAGDTIVHFSSRRTVVSVPFFNGQGATVGLVSVGPETTHNFQSNVGFGFRF